MIIQLQHCRPRPTVFSTNAKKHWFAVHGFHHAGLNPIQHRKIVIGLYQTLQFNSRGRPVLVKCIYLD